MGKPGEDSTLVQSVNLSTVTFNTGDALTFTAYVKQGSAPNNTPIAKLLIKYTDGTPKSVIRLRMPKNKTPGYVQLIAPRFVISNTNIAKIKVKVRYGLPSGKFFIDDVSLIHTPAAVVR